MTEEMAITCIGILMIAAGVIWMAGFGVIWVVGWWATKNGLLMEKRDGKWMATMKGDKK